MESEKTTEFVEKVDTAFKPKTPIPVDSPYFNLIVEYCCGEYDAKRTLKYELDWAITWPEAIKYFIAALQAVGYVIGDEKYDYIMQKLDDVLS